MRRNKQIIAGRKYIKKPKFVGGRLTPPKYEKGEKIEFDPGNMWHLQAALDDQPLSSELISVRTLPEPISKPTPTRPPGLLRTSRASKIQDGENVDVLRAPDSDRLGTKLKKFKLI